MSKVHDTPVGVKTCEAEEGACPYVKKGSRHLSQADYQAMVNNVAEFYEKLDLSQRRGNNINEVKKLNISQLMASNTAYLKLLELETEQEEQITNYVAETERQAKFDEVLERISQPDRSPAQLGTVALKEEVIHKLESVAHQWLSNYALNDDKSAIQIEHDGILINVEEAYSPKEMVVSFQGVPTKQYPVRWGELKLIPVDKGNYALGKDYWTTLNQWKQLNSPEDLGKIEKKTQEDLENHLITKPPLLSLLKRREWNIERLYKEASLEKAKTFKAIAPYITATTSGVDLYSIRQDKRSGAYEFTYYNREPESIPQELLPQVEHTANSIRAYVRAKENGSTLLGRLSNSNPPKHLSRALGDIDSLDAPTIIPMFVQIGNN